MFPLPIALPIALAAIVVAAVPAGAFAPALLTASLDGGQVQASVLGTLRTGAWKLVLTMPGATERLRTVLERGDIWGGGFVLVERREGDRWVTVERRSLDRHGRLDQTVCAPAIDACVLAGTIRAPQPGAQRLAAAFRVRGHGHWTLTGSTRQASEPFILGPWLDAPVEDLRF